ncbi:phragmoplastin interacting protein 1-like [Salvia hispanica]|uniref:phragmoplastin interacting protein 1-like n=1 Tax=Salvia hispanica TaxID=49212 RepID=UPI00200999A4|nr:phragmoplastin interacting protein 1-like [Salvia hispanica]
MTFPDTGKFRGIAIITFKTEATAKMALALDGSDMGGFFLKIQPFKQATENDFPNLAPSVPEGYSRIYVGNMSWDITQNDLKIALAGCAIKSIRFGEDNETVSYAPALLNKGTASESKPTRINNQVDYGKEIDAACLKVPPKDYQVKVVAAAGLKAPPGDYRVNSYNNRVAVENQVSSSVTSAVSSKKQKRACYDCEVQGHLSSSCPKKQATDPINPD